MSRFLRAYEECFAKMTDAPPEFGHASGLAILSTVALGRRWVERGSGKVTPNLFLMLTAGSSRDRKSTTVQTAMKMIAAVEPRRVGPEDFTAEGIVSHMRSRPGTGKTRSKIILGIEEFGNYLATAQRAYGSNMSATLCKLYDGQSFERVRSGKKAVKITSPKLNLLGGVAYGMLEKFADPLEWITGFFARIIWIIPMAQRERFAVQPEFPAAEWMQAVDDLKHLTTELKMTYENSGAFKIADDASAMYRAFAAEASAAAEKLGDPAMVAQRERLNNTVLKLAMLYQIDIDPMQPISARAMERAIFFAKQAWLGFWRVYTRTDGTPFGRLVNKVWRRMTELKRVNRRDLYRAVHLKVDEITPAIDLLLKAGILSQTRVQPAEGGPASLGYEVLIPYEEAPA